MKEVRIFSPATVSNVGPGFDLMGFALNKPGDILRIQENGLGEIRIFNETPYDLPVDPEKNIASVAALALLKHVEGSAGYDFYFEHKIRPGSGIGSSAASCSAAVFGINELLGRPLNPEALIPFALEGEFLASGSLHADNIAPAMLGKITLIRSYDPLDIIQLEPPETLWCAVVHPELEIKTAESRKRIPAQLSLQTALQQNGNLAGLIAALTTQDYDLLSRCLDDFIAEPVRKNSIPGYSVLKKTLTGPGILGMNISGSGPSIFALCTGEAEAKDAANTMKDFFRKQNIAAEPYYSRISDSGTRIIS